MTLRELHHLIGLKIKNGDPMVDLPCVTQPEDGYYEVQELRPVNVSYFSAPLDYFRDKDVVEIA